MKRLSGTFAFVVLALIAIVTVFSCCTRRLSVGHDVLLSFGTPVLGTTEVKYVDVDEDRLKKALDKLKKDGKCFIAFKNNDGKKVSGPYYGCNNSEIMIDSITTSPNAKNGPAGESAANDPNITYRVLGKSKYVKAVVNSFKE